MDVLLVEDDALVRDVLAELLAEAGMRVTETADPKQALDLPEATAPPTVLVTDIDLGVGMNGVALAVAARRRWPSLRVVLISGRPDNLNGYRLRPSDRLLLKPFLSADLLGAIQELTAA